MNARSTTGTHGALRNLCIAAATGLTLVVQGQVAFPDQYIQDVNWTTGTHHWTLAQPIIAPGDVEEPTVVSGTADAEFVSGTSIHLTEGFHAGNFTGDGHFHAYIDEGIDGADAVAIITPAVDPIVDGMLHVKKWEKLEIGLKLHPPYLAAIESFFANYYPYDPNDIFGNRPTPGDVDIVHDLNPYADDSLQVYMILTDPENVQRMKWAFYMKEVTWGPDGDLALPVDDPTNPLDAWRMRFRYAPDMEGPWTFRIGIHAPHTLDVNDAPLPVVDYTTYSFFCDPPLEGKHGPLHVNTVNNRMLEHEDGTPFLGMGTNMADVMHAQGDFTGEWSRFYQRDMTHWKQSMDQLHEAGGNFLRMMLTQNHFAHEVVNLGVYDRYQGVVSCELAHTLRKGDCQHQSWSFDKLLEHAAYNNIYLQLCVDPDKPSEGLGHLWQSMPYVTQFLDTDRDAQTGRYSLMDMFYMNGSPSMRDEPNTSQQRNVFYFWKRKYKYLMNRWGYSPSLAIIEPFNEIDHMLGYGAVHTMGATSGVCSLNQLTWPIEPDLPETLDVWLTDIKDYVNGEVVANEPVASPLGEKKLMTISYSFNELDINNRQTFYKPFYNSKVDLMDAHMYLGPHDGEEDDPDVGLDAAVRKVSDFHDQVLPGHFPLKPFNMGEHDHGTVLTGWSSEIEKIFMNYDVSFHNEIWSGAFSGKWGTGTSWHWERVFWWPDAVLRAPTDGLNLFQFDQFNQFSNTAGDDNDLLINGAPRTVRNRRLVHHFKPLADLLGDQLWLDYGFFNGNFTPRKVFDGTPVQQIPDDLEAYYLVRESTYPELDQNLAIGWVHNRNAWTMNNYYLRSTRQNFLGCTPPTPSSTITLTGFAANTDFYVTWFPTRTNSPILPPATPSDDALHSNGSGQLIINFEPGQFGGIVDNYMDTLRTDYAFIVSPEPFFKSRTLTPNPEDHGATTVWDFALFPNPAREELYLRLPDERPVDVELLDLSGRRARVWNSLTGSSLALPLSSLAKGAYWVRVSDGARNKVRKLIVQ
ncbi:MAG TPA: T9SS type A sorting domain-containing protein [Flavobacteriales bacterium]|nr:T9SS type A sorting domain-containing protein [Flavobacteriales bacterium]